MYWDLGLLPGTSKKWKVRPIGASAGNAHFPALNHSILLGNLIRRIIPSTLLGYLI